MGRGLALTALLGALALLASCAQEDEVPTTPIATGTDSSPTLTPTSASPTATTAWPAGLDPDDCSEQITVDKCLDIYTYTPLPTATVAPPDAHHLRDTRTGVPEVDAVIDAVLNKDARALAGLVSFLTYPCQATVTVQPAPLLCADGQPAGTPLVGIWANHVEGGLWPPERDGDREKLVPIFATMLDSPGLQLHSVYALDGTEPGEEFLRPDYVVTFVSWDARSGPWYDNFVVRDGGLIAINFAFPPFNPPIWDNPDDPGWLLPRAR
ncbi:MAG: hypothetical protein WD557_15610 [Dehalococcoidia bacterium]